MQDIEVLHHNYQLIAKAITYIDTNFKDQPSIDEIAKNIGMSKYHFIRVFKEYVGVTPKQYLHSITLNYAKEHIKKSKSILDSSLDIGLSSTSRLHELFVNLIGVTPKEWREKGKDVTITYGFGMTPFGEALIAYTHKGVCYLGLISNNKDLVYKRFLELWENANLQENNVKVQHYLDDIFIKNKKYNLMVKGTNLQINVWKALLNLPNETINLDKNNEKEINQPITIQAVSNVIKNNYIEYLIPCHRVIVKSGAMSGFQWGAEKKKNYINNELNNKNDITYRVAVLEDIPTLCSLLHQLFSLEIEFVPNNQKQVKSLSKILQNPKIGTIYVACCSNKIVGMVNVLYTISTALGEKVAILEDMIIDEKYRGKNIGASLLEYSINLSKKNGCKRITLLTDDTNLSAHKFYNKMGFKKSTMIPFRMQF